MSVGFADRGGDTANTLSIDDLRSVILSLLVRYDLKRAFLFGSYARGEASDDSDIDLIVKRRAGSHRLSVYALGKDVREATGKRVGIFDMSEPDDVLFKQTVTGEAIVL